MPEGDDAPDEVRGDNPRYEAVQEGDAEVVDPPADNHAENLDGHPTPTGI